MYILSSNVGGSIYYTAVWRDPSRTIGAGFDLSTTKRSGHDRRTSNKMINEMQRRPRTSKCYVKPYLALCRDNKELASLEWSYLMGTIIDSSSIKNLLVGGDSSTKFPE